MTHKSSRSTLQAFACLSLFREADDAALASIIRCATAEMSWRRKVAAAGEAVKPINLSPGVTITPWSEFVADVFPRLMAPVGIEPDGRAYVTHAGYAWGQLVGGKRLAL